MTLKARVRGGRLVIDEPTNLPEGTELELLPLDPGDWLDDADRERTWWLENRDYEDLFAAELEKAIEILAVLSGAGTPYTHFAAVPRSSATRCCLTAAAHPGRPLTHFSNLTMARAAAGGCSRMSGSLSTYQG